MKDDKYFDLATLKGKDLIIGIKRMPQGDRRELAAERLFAAGLMICNVAFSLAKDCDNNLNLSVKFLRRKIRDAKDALRILDDLLKEVKDE